MSTFISVVEAAILKNPTLAKKFGELPEHSVTRRCDVCGNTANPSTFTKCGEDLSVNPPKPLFACAPCHKAYFEPISGR